MMFGKAGPCCYSSKLFRPIPVLPSNSRHIMRRPSLENSRSGSGAWTKLHTSHTPSSGSAVGYEYPTGLLAPRSLQETVQLLVGSVTCLAVLESSMNKLIEPLSPLSENRDGSRSVPNEIRTGSAFAAALSRYRVPGFPAFSVAHNTESKRHGFVWSSLILRHVGVCQACQACQAIVAPCFSRRLCLQPCGLGPVATSCVVVTRHASAPNFSPGLVSAAFARSPFSFLNLTRLLLGHAVGLDPSAP